MSDYKEHPLDESNGNPFKVGDMVRVYDILLNEDLVWEVTNILGDQLALYAKNFRASYHYKQCRPLTKEKPREFVVFFDSKGQIECGCETKDLNPDFKPSNNRMLVREVLDD